MVYCGKPSRGCQMCRTRRIKCDETKPTCLQCQKSRRQCPGYKDDFDLVFRNETQATERRARRSINSKRIKFETEQRRSDTSNAALTSGSRSQSPLVGSTNAASSGSVPGSVNIPLEIQAFHYFLSNYVLVPQSGTTRGHWIFVLPLLKGEPAGTQLSTSFTAVALASFGNRPSARHLLVRARQEYTKALNLVNRALTNPTTQKSDQTLVSVLLLGLYETITLRRLTLGSWGTHIEGAVMLVRMRGRKQLRDPIGKSLFVTVRSQMLINCMSASKAPDLGAQWWTRGAVRDDVAHEVSRLNLLTCELRADVNQAMTVMPRTQENFDRTLELIRRAQELEQGFLDWEASLSDEWRCKTVAWADTIPDSDLSISEVYSGKVDMFQDLFVASQWNMARVARLILAGIIIRCAAWICAPVDYRTTSHYAQASRLGIEMINDIVASIPYHLGWRGFKANSEDRPTTGNISSFVCGQDDIGTGKSLGAYFLIWPVFTSIVSDFATDAQRKYIIGRMRYMTEAMGINGAGVLTEFQLRLPSMIVKRDLMCMFTAGKMPAGAYASKPPGTTPSPTAPSSTASSASSFSTYKNPSFDSRASSISTATMAGASPSHSITESAGKEQEEEEILEAQAQIGPDYEKKKAEKEAFAKTYGPAIKETCGDNFNMEYLHPESGQGKRTAEIAGNSDGNQNPDDWEEKPALPKP